MTQILLVGSDASLLEGLSQSLAALGHSPHVVATVHEAREFAVAAPPLIAVVERSLAVEGAADMLRIPLAPGGALVLYQAVGGQPVTLAPTLQRTVLADLTLPLERNRLAALAQHVEDRARVTGRSLRQEPPTLEA